MIDARLPVPEIESRIEAAMGEWGIPGASVAIIADGAVVSRRGYGRKIVGGSDAVAPDTRFAIGSLSKAFIAAAVGILVDDGLLGWDDRVTKHVPDFKLSDPWITDNLNIRDLLCHRTGLKRSIRLMWKDPVFDPDDFLARARYLGFDRGFRTGFGYANIHFILAAKIIETVSGVPWEHFVSERLFKSLGMGSTTATYTELDGRARSLMAAPHANVDGGLVPGALRCLDPVSPIPMSDLGRNAAGSIVSTVEDMTHWLDMLMHGGSYAGRKILSEASVAEMLALQVPLRAELTDMRIMGEVGIKSSFMGYGLGWYLMDYRGERMVFHDGQLRGYSSAAAFIPTWGVGAIILTNVFHSAFHQMIGFELLDALRGIRSDYCSPTKALMLGYRSHVEAETQLALERGKAVPALTPAATQQLEGDYESQIFGIVSIRMERQDGPLVYRYGSCELHVAELDHFGGDVFRIRYLCGYVDDEFLTFSRSADGKAAGLSIPGVDEFRRIR